MILVQKLKAMEFADGSGGLILKLTDNLANSTHKVMKFECKTFSVFTEERETLFFGGDTELQIKGIIQRSLGKWRHYDKYMMPINALHRMMSGQTLNGLEICEDVALQMKMNCIIQDHLRSQLKSV